MKKLLVSILSISLFYLSLSISFAQTHFTAKLTGSQEVPAVTTNASGTGSFKLTSDGLEFNVTVNGLSGAITGAHFHRAPAGKTGSVVRGFTSSEISGNNISGTWKKTDSQALTDSLIIALLNGELYVNIHTSANSSGEIRGQVYVSGGSGFTAKLDGNQEVPPVTTNAKGTSSLTLTQEGLVYSVTVDGLSGAITGSHFHNAATGQAGGVVRAITFVGNTAIGVWRKTDSSQPLTDQLISELLAGRIYINIHTSANAGGEIRGQVNPVVITGIKLISENFKIPKEFGLLQNFPNPFNPITEIHFTLNNTGHTTLKVYNILGQEVATLINENLKAGSYKVTFDASNLSSGIYFYQLKINGLSKVRKMVLLR
jgi:Cu/Zn superoxide dismutase